MASRRASTPGGTPAPATGEMAERAARIAEMLDRWAAQDVSAEPDWTIDNFEPLTLRSTDSKPPK